MKVKTIIKYSLWIVLFWLLGVAAIVIFYVSSSILQEFSDNFIMPNAELIVTILVIIFAPLIFGVLIITILSTAGVFDTSNAQKK